MAERDSSRVELDGDVFSKMIYSKRCADAEGEVTETCCEER